MQTRVKDKAYATFNGTFNVVQMEKHEVHVMQNNWRQTWVQEHGKQRNEKCKEEKQ